MTHDKHLVTLSTTCLGELTRSLMSLNCSRELLTSWFQKIILSIFMSLWEQITHRCGSVQFEPQGYRLQRVGWIYVVNHYALLHTKYKSYWLHGFKRFFNVFPIIKKLMTDPHGMAKLDPKGIVDTIYAGDHIPNV